MVLAQAALKDSKLLAWTKTYKIAELFFFKKNNNMMMSFPSKFSLTLKTNSINCQFQLLILKHPKPKGRILHASPP